MADTGSKVCAAVGISYLVAPDATYWLMTGVLSSIGIGFGFHTGPLILFPHVSEVAADEPRFSDAFSRCVFPTFFWGLGTALGELPPFLAGPHLADSMPRVRNMIEGIKPSIDRYGGLFIFLLACYPNATFDSAGIVAGAVGMSTAKFLTATISGKTFVKAPLQTCFVIASTHGLVAAGATQIPYLEEMKILWGVIASCFLIFTVGCLIETVGNRGLELKAENTDKLSASYLQDLRDLEEEEELHDSEHLQ